MTKPLAPDDPILGPAQEPEIEMTLAGITRAYLRGDLPWETYRAYERQLEAKQMGKRDDEAD